jgi:hypothetical protein
MPSNHYVLSHYVLSHEVVLNGGVDCRWMLRLQKHPRGANWPNL